MILIKHHSILIKMKKFKTMRIANAGEDKEQEISLLVRIHTAMLMLLWQTVCYKTKYIITIKCDNHIH